MKHKGLSLLEFCIVVAIIAVAMTILLNRLYYYEEVAEKVSMEVTFSSLKSALRMQMANDMMAGRAVDYERLARENPTSWLENKPANYLGEYHNPDVMQLPRGSWYFDNGQREMVYLPKLAKHLVPDDAGLLRVRYQAKLVNGQDLLQGQVVGLKFEVVESYQWFSQE